MAIMSPRSARRLHAVLGHVVPASAAVAAAHVEAAAALAPLPTLIKSGFGAVLEIDRAMLQQLLVDDPTGDAFRHMWQSTGGGLMVLRGLVDLTPEELVAVSNVFGEMEGEAITGAPRGSKSSVLADGSNSVARLGNTKSEDGRLTASFINAGPVLEPDESPQYRPHDTHGNLSGLPIWHTDSVFRANPPVGSLFFCRQAPAGGGGATCFADTRAAFEALDAQRQAEVGELECVCSLAHHDAKIHTCAHSRPHHHSLISRNVSEGLLVIIDTPTYPLLGQTSCDTLAWHKARENNPAQRVPLVLTHPLTGRRALYGAISIVFPLFFDCCSTDFGLFWRSGLNGGTCAVIPRGETFSQEQLDAADVRAERPPRPSPQTHTPHCHHHVFSGVSEK